MTDKPPSASDQVAVPKGISLLDENAQALPYPGEELLARRPALTMIACTLYDLFHHQHRTGHLGSALAIGMFEDGEYAFFSLQVTGAPDGTIDEDMIEAVDNFLEMLKTALTKGRITGIEVSLEHGTLGGPSKESFLLLLDQLGQTHGFVLGAEPGYATKPSVGNYRLVDIARALESQSDESRQEKTQKPENPGIPSASTISLAFADAAEEGPDSPSELEKADRALSDILCRLMDPQKFNYAYYTHLKGIRYCLMPIHRDGSEDKLLEKFFAELAPLELPSGVSLNKEDWVIRFSDVAALNAFASLIGTHFKPEPKPSAQAGHVAQADEEKFEVWGYPLPQNALDMAHLMLQGLSHYHCGAGYGVIWEHQLNGKNHVFTARIEEDESYHLHKDIARELLKELITLTGHWEGVSIDPDNLTIYAANIRPLTVVLDAYAERNSIAFGTEFLSRVEMAQMSEKDFACMEEALKEDPTILHCLPAKSYGSKEEMLKDVARVIRAAETGRFVCPYTSSDVLRAMSASPLMPETLRPS